MLIWTERGTLFSTGGSASFFAVAHDNRKGSCDHLGFRGVEITFEEHRQGGALNALRTYFTI
jgi:hypothetical protein